MKVDQGQVTDLGFGIDGPILDKYKCYDCRRVILLLRGFCGSEAYLSLTTTALHFSFSLGLLLAGQVVSLVHEKRQFGGLFGTGKGSKVKDITDVKPRIRPDAKRQLIRYGPFTIPAMTNVRNSGILLLRSNGLHRIQRLHLMDSTS